MSIFFSKFVTKITDIHGSKKQTTKVLDELMEMVPNATLKVNGETSELVALDSIQEGDIIEVRPYDVVPLDGIVIKGSSYIDDSSITGEPLLKEKTVNDEVVSGSKNQQSTLFVKVTKTKENSTMNQIIKMVEEASSSKMKTSIHIPFLIQIKMRINLFI